MRAALWLISLFALAAAGAWLAGHNQGTVTLFLSPLRVDVSLNLAVLAFLLVVLLVVLAQKALAALLSLPKHPCLACSTLSYCGKPEICRGLVELKVGQYYYLSFFFFKIN